MTQVTQQVAGMGKAAHRSYLFGHWIFLLPGRGIWGLL
jgi:hypothetical protein